jgi:hypothetical protein
MQAEEGAAGRTLTVAQAGGPNWVWSMDLFLDRNAEGNMLREPIIVDEANREALAIDAERGHLGYGVARVMDSPALTRDLPQVVLINKGKSLTAGRQALRGNLDSKELRYRRRGYVGAYQKQRLGENPRS